MKSEAAEDISAGLASQEAPSDALSEVATKETPEEVEEDVAGGSDGSESGPLGCMPLPVAACCVCLDLERVSSCIRSEKICILPILACLLSLALCTAGLKWVFVDKIFEYEPPTHLDLKRIGQDPIINSDFTQNSTSVSPSTPSTPSVPGQPKVFVEGESTGRPFEPPSSKVPVFTPTAAVTVHTNSVSPPSPKSTFKPLQNGTANQYPSQTLESNDIVPKTSATSTTPSAKTSSHVTRCSESERNYCVNGGECFTLEVTPGNIRRLCRCLPGYTGNRCQTSDPVRVVDPKQAEELYQKRVLTITGICIALLVVGIMCVVAYCKTKKQRKKLHDRLRQSLRERNAAAKGPQHPHPPPENLQLVNHYMPKNSIPPLVHVTDKEVETSLSTNEFTSSTHPSTAVSHSSSQSWSNGKAESVVSDSHAVLVKSSVENCRHGTPGHRGRLNATGGVHQLNNHLKSSRGAQGSCRDSPYSERYVSAMTTPSRLSPVGLLSPATPSSPPSEMSAPLSSLATSVPSMAASPSGEEERPLLFRTPPILRDKSGLNQSGHNLRNSAHYNHGLELLSPPASPLHTMEQEESSQQYQSTAAASGPNSSRTQPSGQTALETVSGSNSESSSSESETEEDTPFLGLQSPLAAGSVVVDGLEGSRTNPALLLSPQHDLQSRLTAIMANQDPIAV
ncbi:pro-neuregulin-1, membrane-bound isoform isoform X5 [Sinocyclocheilus anshuiensis]|uniref:Pro-neuregulin-1, membrane-bound isoform n=1 Tax=Sinocyclocheilus anshuiensis TaxID=1608454 RepID=A0A671S7C7_9TELE|nr:PREDICTED: pro-neuregulin-1, membrane-bound isoform isoform X4 [Sinocyclocheilus anshuiensis]XP_016311830.1 PREDICTED: pro-neuregulin-1, membrane-bound isoform isoform X5 [Sinocyclocheilus anshuiensis]